MKVLLIALISLSASSAFACGPGQYNAWGYCFDYDGGNPSNGVNAGGHQRALPHAYKAKAHAVSSNGNCGPGEYAVWNFCFTR